VHGEPKIFFNSGRSYSVKKTRENGRIEVPENDVTNRIID
jgi:hypothetical protein